MLLSDSALQNYDVAVQQCKHVTVIVDKDVQTHTVCSFNLNNGMLFVLPYNNQHLHAGINGI